MKDGRRLVEILVIAGLAGLAAAGTVYLVHLLARDGASDSAATIIDDCRDRIASIDLQLERRA